MKPLAILLLAVAASAHEPVFAPGPHVPGEGIWGFELEHTYERHHEIETIAHYGPGPDSEAALKIRTMVEDHANGLGDLGLQYKSRFWRVDDIGKQTGAAALVAIDLPTGDRSRGLGRGAYGAKIGATVGTEQLVYSGWAAAEFGMKDLYSTSSGRAEWGGLWTRLGLIGGRRFYQPRHYKDWDFPVYLSAHYINEGPERFGGMNMPNTGRQAITIGPSILPGKYFVMTRLGVQVPIWEQRRGDQPKMPITTKFVIEIHY
jgi:hypothetical protein